MLSCDKFLVLRLTFIHRFEWNESLKYTQSDRPWRRLNLYPSALMIELYLCEHEQYNDKVSNLNHRILFGRQNICSQHAKNNRHVGCQLPFTQMYLIWFVSRENRTRDFLFFIGKTVQNTCSAPIKKSLFLV